MNSELPISPDEIERRIRMASQLRDVILKLREGARKAYEEGRSPYRPGYDLRSDYDYWRRIAEEKGILSPE